MKKKTHINTLLRLNSTSSPSYSNSSPPLNSSNSQTSTTSNYDDKSDTEYIKYLLSDLINSNFDPENLFTVLEDGVVLCELIRKIYPQEKFEYFVFAFSEEEKAENIQIFLDYCGKIGKFPTFKPYHLFEKANHKLIVSTIVNFGQTSSFGRTQRKLSATVPKPGVKQSPRTNSSSQILKQQKEIEKFDFTSATTEQILALANTQYKGKTLTNEQLMGSLKTGVDLCLLAQRLLPSFSYDFHFTCFSDQESEDNFHTWSLCCRDLSQEVFTKDDLVESNMDHIRNLIKKFAIACISGPESASSSSSLPEYIPDASSTGSNSSLSLSISNSTPSPNFGNNNNNLNLITPYQVARRSPSLNNFSGYTELTWSNEAKKLFTSKITFEKIMKLAGQNISNLTNKQIFKLFEDGTLLCFVGRMLWPPHLSKRYIMNPTTQDEERENFAIFLTLLDELSIEPFPYSELKEAKNIEVLKQTLVQVAKESKSYYKQSNNQKSKPNTSLPRQGTKEIISFDRILKLMGHTSVDDTNETQIRELLKDGTFLCRLSQHYCPSFNTKSYYTQPTTEREIKYNFELFAGACVEAGASKHVFSYEDFKNVKDLIEIRDSVVGFVVKAKQNARELVDKAKLRDSFLESSTQPTQETEELLLHQLLKIAKADLPSPLSDDQLFEILEDGVLLCQLLKHLYPPRATADFFITTFCEDDKMMNIKDFLSCLDELGVQKFNTDDLKNKQNIEGIKKSIVAFGRAAFNYSVMKHKKRKKPIIHFKKMTNVRTLLKKEINLIDGSPLRPRLKLINKFIDLSAEDILRIVDPEIQGELSDQEFLDHLHNGVNLCLLLKKLYPPFGNKEFYFSTFSSEEEEANIKEFLSACTDLSVQPFELEHLQRKENAESIRMCILNFANVIFCIAKQVTKQLSREVSEEDQEILSSAKNRAITRHGFYDTLTPASDMAEFFFEYIFSQSPEMKQYFQKAQTQLKAYSGIVNTIVHKLNDQNAIKKFLESHEKYDIKKEHIELFQDALVFSFRRRLNGISFEEELLLRKGYKVLGDELSKSKALTKQTTKN